MNKNYFNLAKKYDKNGKFAFWGMCDYLKECYDVNFLDDNENDAIEYIVETYLEYIDSVSFRDWIIKGNKNGRPLVLTEYKFKKMYSEIFQNNSTLESAIDDIASIYDCEWWIFNRYEESSPCLATTYFKDYKPIDNKAIMYTMIEYGILVEKDIATKEDKEKFIQKINKAMNNYFNNFKTNKMSNHELLYEINRVTGGYLD